VVYIVGSRARADYLVDSDVDILVVADNLPGDSREAYDVVRRLKGKSTFLVEVLEDRLVVYADPRFLESVMRKYREVGGRWVRRGRTWEGLTSKTYVFN